jgi:SagB-type dehydrogenase family enzyme
MRDAPDSTDDSSDRVRRVLSYHRRTKHQLHRYAQSLGYLDWATQPEPFRTFAGAPVVELPLLADALRSTFADLYHPGRIPERRADLNSIAVLFELALGLSAWKEYKGSRWALRCNPSSGNLHPTEGYAVLPPLPGIAAGVYHYVSRDHALERRCTWSAAKAACLGAALPPGALLVGLSSIHWREAWKYGERAFRYCQHDAGHALAAVRYAAAALGWSARLLDHLGDEAVSAWLGLNSEAFAGVAPLDREHPDALILVGPPPLPDTLPRLSPPGDGEWSGSANPLSPRHIQWEVIDNVAEATLKPASPAHQARANANAWETDPATLASRGGLATFEAAALTRQRRSCLALDGRTGLDADRFYGMLDRLLLRPGVPPWDMLPWAPHLHTAVFVHRVHGLRPGLYLFERSPTVHDDLKAACRPAFAWQKPAGCPDHLAFYLLAEGDFRTQARTVSCHQEIAADGAFSLGMLAAFGDTIRTNGAWWYRRLFWEAGVLGHVLYLEAEAAGLRGTGIGCYFDDVMHEILGLQGDRWQDLYHFTIGGPVEDTRLRTEAPYAHLRR